MVSESPHLVVGEGQQVEHGGATRQGLTHGLEQSQILGAREDEAPGPRIGVDQTLKVRRKIRCALNFVDYGAIGKLGEKGARVAGGEGAYVRRFKVRVGQVRKQCFAERGLAALARTGERDGGELPRCLK